MGIAVPDCTLDKMCQGILNRNTALGFSIQSVRTQLSLDVQPLSWLRWRPLQFQAKRQGRRLSSTNDEWLSALTGQRLPNSGLTTRCLRMILHGVSVETSRLENLPDPAFAAEQPEDPEIWFDARAQPQVARPSESFPSFWATPEWKALKDKYHLQKIGFDQGCLGHARAKPTTLGTNLLPVPWLLNGGPGLDVVGLRKSGKPLHSQRKLLAHGRSGLLISGGDA